MKNTSKSYTDTGDNHKRKFLEISYEPKSIDDLKGVNSDEVNSSERATKNRMESWDVSAQSVIEVSNIVEKAALENNISASMIYAVIWVESRFNPQAVSPVGARGLMQLMPRTATYLAECMEWEGEVDSFDPEFNIAAGTYYLAKLLRQFEGDLDLALAAYNAGPGNIRKWMNNTGLPPVSIQYYTMVKTAQNYFHSEYGASGYESMEELENQLDQLGLAILIARLQDRDFGLDRTDDTNPFLQL